MTMPLSIPNELSSRFDTVAGRKELIERYGDSGSMFLGNNAEGETVHLFVDVCGIILRTEQQNGWVRMNYYDADGVAIGESFDGKWKEAKTDGS